jgi:hypothetical protein
MSFVGLALISAGLYLLLKKNPAARAEVMKLLSHDQQVQLNNFLNAEIDITGQLAALKKIDMGSDTCTGPSDSTNTNCATANGANASATSPESSAVGAAGTPAPTKEYDPATATAAETLKELQRVQKERKEVMKQLNEIN